MYEPFGIAAELKADESAPANPFRSPASTSTQRPASHLRARQYDPSTGRFLQLDPQEPETDEPFVSSYAYAANRPTVFVDPSGMTLQPSSLGQRAVMNATSAGRATFQPGDIRSRLAPECGGGGGVRPRSVGPECFPLPPLKKAIRCIVGSCKRKVGELFRRADKLIDDAFRAVSQAVREQIKAAING